MFNRRNIEPELLKAVIETHNEAIQLEARKQELFKEYGVYNESGLTIEQKQELNKRLNEAYKGNPGRDGVAAAGGGTPADKGHVAAKFEGPKKARKENVKVWVHKTSGKEIHSLTKPSDEFKEVKKIREENLSEISKQTLGSYVKKASHDVATKSAATGRYGDRSNTALDKYKKTSAYSDWEESKKNGEKADRFFKKSWKRREGIAKATDKLVKEEENIQEVSRGLLTRYKQQASMDAINRGTTADYARTAAKAAFDKSKRNKAGPTRDRNETEGQRLSQVADTNAKKRERRHAGLGVADKKLWHTSKVKPTNEELVNEISTRLALRYLDKGASTYRNNEKHAEKAYNKVLAHKGENDAPVKVKTSDAPKALDVAHAKIAQKFSPKGLTNIIKR